MSVQVINTLPREVGVAVSGGVDSMVALHFLRQKHQVTAIHFSHAESATAEAEYAFVAEHCREHKIPLLLGYQITTRPPGASREAYWRRDRYGYFHSIRMPIVTGHHLDDAVEWYLFTAFNGEGHYMEYRNQNVIRPFLGTPKSVILEYAAKYQVPFIEDTTNADPDFAARNRIRKNILPEVLTINPGLYKVVKKRVVEKAKLHKDQS